MPGGQFCTVTSTPHHPQKAGQQEIRGTIETLKKTPVDSRRAEQEDIAQGQRATMFYRSAQEGWRNCSIALGLQGNASKQANAQNLESTKKKDRLCNVASKPFCSRDRSLQAYPYAYVQSYLHILVQNGVEAQRFKNWILKCNDFWTGQASPLKLIEFRVYQNDL